MKPTHSFKNPPDTRVLIKEAGEFKVGDYRYLKAYMLLMSVTSDIMSFIDRDIALYNISQTRIRILMALRRENGNVLPPSVIASKLDLKKSTITELVKGLSKSGYIKKISNKKDKRFSSIVLTSKGKKFLNDVMPMRYGNIERLFKVLTLKELDALINISLKIKSNIK